MAQDAYELIMRNGVGYGGRYDPRQKDPYATYKEQEGMWAQVQGQHPAASQPLLPIGTGIVGIGVVATAVLLLVRRLRRRKG